MQKKYAVMGSSFMDSWKENVCIAFACDWLHYGVIASWVSFYSPPPMDSPRTTAIAACFLGVLIIICNARSSEAVFDPSAMSSLAYPTHEDSSIAHVLRISTSDLQNRQVLEQSIQLAAFEQFDSHKTGKLYNVSVSASPSGTFQAIRLRSGSFRRYGVNISEFTIPRGCVVNPIPERVLLVYAQLVNTTLFQSLPGSFVLASPVLSVLVYDAANVNSTQSPTEQISVSATAAPISIQFPRISNAKCAYFSDNSTDVNITDLIQGTCQVNHLGNFALVISGEAPAPSPAEAQAPGARKSHSNTWKIVVGSVVGGLALLVLVSLLAVGIGKCRKNVRLQRMEHQAEQGETLRTATIGNSRVPEAAETRTQATLENDYAV